MKVLSGLSQGDHVIIGAGLNVLSAGFGWCLFSGVTKYKHTVVISIISYIHLITLNISVPEVICLLYVFLKCK